MKKENKKQIFIVFEAPEDSGDSIPIMATTSKRKLKKFIAEKIKKDDFFYFDSAWSKTRQIKEFKLDFEKETRDNICKKLNWGFYDYCYDGVEFYFR